MKKRSACVIILILVCAVIVGVAVTATQRYGLGDTVSYAQTDEPLNNPLTGYAPNARSIEACADSELVFILITWAEWEPSPDYYNIAGLEERFHIPQWKAENKHAVLRFVCDYPSEEEHLDIPYWLYDSTQDGQYYDISHGKGYSPNYANEYFRQRHSMAVKALADYCNQDSFVSYVELGSLGHWGEWHTSRSQGIRMLPDAQICREYVLDYSENFTNAKLLTRRNYTISVEQGVGIYNDMTGNPDSTRSWLDWTVEGGSYKTEGEELTYKPISNFWEVAPVGGELTSTYPRQELLGVRFAETLELVERSHMTFIGPNCPTKEERQSQAAIQLRERLGYRLYISELNTAYSLRGNCLKVSLTWENVGLAPLYWDWPVTMYVYDQTGELLHQQELSDLALSQLAPGKPITVQGEIPYTKTLQEGYRIGVGITSPDGREHIRLAMESERDNDGIHLIYTYEE